MLLLALALAGCSTVKLGYNNLPELTYWWLDSYMGFSEEQAPRVRAELRRVHQWHRAAELPRLARSLQHMEQLAPADLDAAQVCELADQLRERLQALRQHAQPALTEVARTLTTAQLAQVARRHERNEREFRHKWLGLEADELARRRAKQFEEHSERLYGRLEPAQRAALREALAPSVFDPGQALAERLRRQADTLQTLRALQAPDVTPAQAQELVGAWLDRLQHSPNPRYRAVQQALLQENCAALASVHNAASPAQRQRAIERLRGWQQDLGELAVRP